MLICLVVFIREDYSGFFRKYFRKLGRFNVYFGFFVFIGNIVGLGGFFRWVVMLVWGRGDVVKEKLFFLFV